MGTCTQSAEVHFECARQAKRIKTQEK